ncbi:MAG: hypothetical protein Q9217_001686 [Psora testacea]
MTKGPNIQDEPESGAASSINESTYLITADPPSSPTRSVAPSPTRSMAPSPTISVATSMEVQLSEASDNSHVSDCSNDTHVSDTSDDSHFSGIEF